MGWQVVSFKIVSLEAQWDPGFYWAANVRDSSGYRHTSGNDGITTAHQVAICRWRRWGTRSDLVNTPNLSPLERKTEHKPWWFKLIHFILQPEQAWMCARKSHWVCWWKGLDTLQVVNAFHHVLLSSVSVHQLFIKAIVPYTWQFSFPKQAIFNTYKTTPLWRELSLCIIHFNLALHSEQYWFINI